MGDSCNICRSTIVKISVVVVVFVVVVVLVVVVVVVVVVVGYLWWRSVSLCKGGC